VIKIAEDDHPLVMIISRRGMITFSGAGSERAAWLPSQRRRRANEEEDHRREGQQDRQRNPAARIAGHYAAPAGLRHQVQ
jgi:hypothetical protein